MHECRVYKIHRRSHPLSVSGKILDTWTDLIVWQWLTSNRCAVYYLRMDQDLLPILKHHSIKWTYDMLFIMHATSMESDEVLFKISFAMELSCSDVLGRLQIAQAEETFSPLACTHNRRVGQKYAPTMHQTSAVWELMTVSRSERSRLKRSPRASLPTHSSDKVLELGRAKNSASDAFRSANEKRASSNLRFLSTC
jgi:hypothetical protein